MKKVLWLVVLVCALTSLGCRKLLAQAKKGRPDASAPALATSDPSGEDLDVITLGELHVTLPGTPKTSTSRDPSPSGEVIITRHEVSVGDSYFAASLIDVPDAKTWNSEGSVTGAIDNALASVRQQKGTKRVRATRERAVTVGPMTGRDVSAVVEQTDGTTLYARLLSVSRTRRNVFILAVVHSDDDPLVKKMFASLEPN